jgi:hypothetical protein
MARLGIPQTHAHRFPFWAKQPFSSLYILLKLVHLIWLLPGWALYYLPTKNRGRPSWTLKESLMVKLVSWIMPLNAMGGLSPMSTDKTREVPEHELKETSFVWLEPASPQFLQGVASDAEVPRPRVPAYVWPKGATVGTLPDDDGTGLICLFLHGGGYMMGHAGETYPECGMLSKHHYWVNHS